MQVQWFHEVEDGAVLDPAPGEVVDALDAVLKVGVQHLLHSVCAGTLGMNGEMTLS